MRRPLVALALFLSGAAALGNQVVWQRALKVFLGGSEELASMVVVLVFMGGLGAGARLAAGRAPRLSRPLLALALLEVGIAAAGLIVRAVLGSGLEESIRPLQATAAASGVPLIVIYATGAALLLVPPCLLMGATMPVGAEVMQRGLGLRDPGVVATLFFVNTLGSAGGGLAVGIWALFHLGLQATMLAASAANALAALLLVVLAALATPAASAPEDPAHQASSPPEAPLPGIDPRHLALLLGFVGLGYEMLLLRLFALRHEPLPYTFAAVITGFLLAWSIGVKAAEDASRRASLPRTLAALAVSLVLVPGVYRLAFPYDSLGALNLPLSIATRALFFLPCLLFGHAFGLLVARHATSWGAHVGTISVWNTTGSCLGVVGITLVGFHLDVLVLPLALAGLVGLGAARPRARLAGAALAGAAVATGWLVDVSGHLDGARYYFGHDGVIAVYPEGDLMWDGLWHSTLHATPGDYVGGNNWRRAVAPVLAHDSGEIRLAGVIGLGAGITTALLASLDSVERVVAYDITRTLEPVLRDYPKGTLGVLADPKVEIRWEDGRMGLALRPEERFDVLVNHPLHLRQVGSSQLNSIEYFELLRSRLAPGGVLCVFAGGTQAQAAVLRETVAHVFPHRAAVFGGYLLLASDQPLGLYPESLARRFQSSTGGLWDEIRGYEPLADPKKIRPFPAAWDAAGVVVTDDRPILEYPGWLEGAVAQHQAGAE